MLKALRKRMESEKGFTLIELMIVVLIIAILLAIAIPTFLRIRRSAQDRAAQSSTTLALEAEESFYDAGFEAYTADNAELEESESSLMYLVAGGQCDDLVADGSRCVSVTVGTTSSPNDTVTLVAASASGTFWAIHDIQSGANAGTYYGAAATAAGAAAEAAGATLTEWPAEA